jgi:hypothetical protein
VHCFTDSNREHFAKMHLLQQRNHNSKLLIVQFNLKLFGYRLTVLIDALFSIPTGIKLKQLLKTFVYQQQFLLGTDVRDLLENNLSVVADDGIEYSEEAFDKWKNVQTVH